ncbi:lipase secretion chaperone [Enterovibrio norvegicus]|uniref:Lipase chaperone n=1 Tax=Enterovibrio norvegicus FF-454 TaxID=1185651 RepID=A0A1E5C9B8_9GAMM|nr:lipase secretion chaperone [Enterovibrio norvegicus]OEE61782.1 hypothetical protein A1OK_08465 [Enterovibrio norvegicus FF-454]OEE77601.1 hypothetical protein A1OQ_00725 [Enterovibrio norvegicus FF-162]
MRITYTSYKIIFLIVVGLVFAAFVYLYANDENEDQAQIRSHLGTDVDISSDRDTFEYFLSTLGEQDLVQVNDAYSHFSETMSFGERQKALFDKYQAYRQSLSLIAAPTSLSGIEYLLHVHYQSLSIQSLHFSEEEQKRLFYEQNLTSEMAIKRLELELMGLDEESYQAQWQSELDQLPPDMKESYQNAALISNLNTLSQQDGEMNIDKIRALVGDDAAQRLHELDVQETAFHQTFQRYLTERGDILDQEFGSDAERDSALTALINTHFSPEDQRRVKALQTLDSEENNASNSI